MKKRTAKVVFGVVLLGIYVSGYVAARQAAWIVHHASYYTDTAGQVRVAGHDVAQGDYGVPMLAPAASIIQSLVVKAYLPTSGIEVLWWKVRVPEGAPWPSGWPLRKRPPGSGS